MQRLWSWLALLLVVAIASGCAHPITMNPDLAAISGDKSAVIPKSVGYHIPESAKALEVTTAGGGGDKVRYFPYRDIEPGFYKALGEAFGSVTRVQDPRNAAAVAGSGIQLLITPEIRTISSSEILRGVMPSDLRCSSIICTTSAFGMASRLPGL